MTSADSGARDEVAAGARVFSADGDELGHIKEVRGDYFKVDAPMARDYWLSRDVVSTVEPDGVTLTVDKDQLGDVKLDELMGEMEEGNLPPAVGAAEPLMEQAVPATPGPAREGLLTSYPPATPIAWEDDPPEREAPE